MSVVTRLHEAVWNQFSNATVEEWRMAADAIRSYGGVE